MLFIYFTRKLPHEVAFFNGVVVQIMDELADIIVIILHKKYESHQRQ